MSSRPNLLLAVEAALGVVGIYYALVAVLMLVFGPILASRGIRDHARRLGWSYLRTVIIGSLLWPVLAWRQGRGRP